MKAALPVFVFVKLVQACSQCRSSALASALEEMNGPQLQLWVHLL
jgi:hypothetical protein